MPPARPPFRADHVGSLVRPPAPKARRIEREVGRASEAEVRAAEAAAIRDGVGRAVGAGAALHAPDGRRAGVAAPGP